MATIKTGNELGMAILKVLGIDSGNVLDVSLNCHPGELAIVSIIRSVKDEEARDLVAVLEHYALERKPEDPSVQAMETVARNLLKG